MIAATAAAAVITISHFPAQQYYKSAFSLVNSAANMTLPAFAAERRAAAPMLLGAGAVDRYVLPAGRSAANPPHAAASDERWGRQTDRETDGRTPDRCVDPALLTIQAVSIRDDDMLDWRF